MPKLKKMFRSNSLYCGDFEWDLVPPEKWYHRQMWVPKSDIVFLWGEETIITTRCCDALDGFSIPVVFELLTFGRLNNIMPGLQASATHDTLCAKPDELYWIHGERRPLTDEERVQVFHDAMICVEELIPDSLEWWLYKGVAFGSKYLGTCNG